MKSIKSFENKKVNVSNEILGGKRYPTGGGSITNDTVVRRDGFSRRITNTRDWNPFNND